MYSNKRNINILTALLPLHGVKNIVVCPGSRNAPLAHNLEQHPEIKCFPVTDERSAAFNALGMMLDTPSHPAAVCVTSGSALLNLSPAVAEAYYRHLPLVVISADRPAARIDQNDGQTIRQPGALANFTAMTVDLPEDDDEYISRLVNIALVEAKRKMQPVHINVRLSEPLFDFRVTNLPSLNDSKLVHITQTTDLEACRMMARRIAEAERPMLVTGCTREMPVELIERLRSFLAVAAEPLATGGKAVNIDRTLDMTSQKPDLVIYTGGSLVSKKLRLWLTESEAHMIQISEYGEICDTFSHLDTVVDADPVTALGNISDYLSEKKDYAEEWNKHSAEARKELYAATPKYSEELAVRKLENIIGKRKNVAVHYANSSSVRLGCKYADHYIYVNRGVNGIDGSGSTAAGHSMVTDKTVYYVTGDLSFFYDQNMLWNASLGGNLRILLLNNGGGEIFSRLPGLKKTPEHGRDIWASHNTSAEGICADNHVEYIRADDETQLLPGLRQLTREEAARPVLMEIIFKNK